MPFRSTAQQREEIAFAAGLYEGEGSCWAGRGWVNGRNGKRYERKTSQFRLTFAMVDREPLERFAAAFPFSVSVFGPYQQVRQGKEWQPQYRITVNGFEKVQAIFAMMWPWLSPRRKAQAIRCLEGATHAVQV